MDCQQSKARFLSTLSLRRATSGNSQYICKVGISIHALLAESDLYQHVGGYHPAISIHALLAESDGVEHCNIADAVKFLSTLSLRRATSLASYFATARDNFYPRSPCGERLEKVPADVFYQAFLSTLSLRRATTWQRGSRITYVEFLSTLSLRRATIRKCQIIPIIQISIHALLAESDAVQIIVVVMHALFLSTLSLRRATREKSE